MTTTIIHDAADTIAAMQDLLPEGLHPLRSLLPECIPHSLRSDAVRKPGDFDPNVLFSVLRHIAMKPGAVLDYFYDDQGSGAEPRIYVRQNKAPQFLTRDDALEWQRRHSVAEYLVLDGTPDSYFECVLLAHLADQFYRFWHAIYGDVTVIASRDELQRVARSVGMDDEGSEALALETTVTVADDGECCSVRLLTFREHRGGFVRKEVRVGKVPPYRSMGEEILQSVGHVPRYTV